MGKGKKFYMNNKKFLDPEILNSQTYRDYLDRFQKIALSMFEWVGLPESMNSRALERALYFDGQAAFLFDENYGFINTRCCSNGNINIYGLPTSLNCYANTYHTNRKLYTGLKDEENGDCILVMNNWERTPTFSTLQLFAYRLTEVENTIFVNVKAQKTPVLLLIDENQRLTLQNLYEQYDGNKPVIFGDKNQIDPNMIRSINTQAPYLADKLMEYKKQIWNEALTFLGINNISEEKKERLITDEAAQNNELINLNLQSLLAPREQACKEFNERYGKNISVKVRSDLHNIIKNENSIISDIKTTTEKLGGNENE